MTSEKWGRVGHTTFYGNQATHKTQAFQIGLNYKASKTETLDLCQLPRPLVEIQKMINLPASVKIFKNKLRN